MAEGVKWELKVREVQRENKKELKSVPGGYVVLQKWTVEQQEKISAMRSSFEGEKEEEVRKDIPPGSLKQFHRLVLQGSLIESNFQKEDGTLEDVKSDEFLDRLLSVGEVEEEIYDLALELNSPLAKESDSSSKTPSKDSSTDQPS